MFPTGGVSPLHHSPLDDALGAFGELTADSRGHGDPLGDDPTPLIANGQARPDLRREERTGAPEVIYASGKDSAQIIALTETFVERTGRAIISRISEADAELV